MKKLLIFLLCALNVGAFGQQLLKRNVFHVVDSETKKAVPSISVAIVRAKLSITTEKDGIFNIPGDLSRMRDTVVLYAQNYTLLKMPLAKLSNMDTIKLSKTSNKIISTQLSYKDDTLLNNFDQHQIGYYVGLNTETAPFEFLQVAQRFQVQKPNVRLKSVTVYKLSFNLIYDNENPDVMYLRNEINGTKHHIFLVSQYEMTEMEHTKYRIRVYDEDPRTGGPGQDLCDKIIEETIKDSGHSNINLRPYNIVIPGKTFFVAIEWLRDYYNAGYNLVYNEKTKKEEKKQNYRPNIGISPTTGKKLNIWGLNFKHDWQPFTYFMPFGTDLAIKASIEY